MTGAAQPVSASTALSKGCSRKLGISTSAASLVVLERMEFPEPVIEVGRRVVVEAVRQARAGSTKEDPDLEAQTEAKFLFSAWHEMRQALQPMQAFRSTAMPHRRYCRGAPG